jgi:hypothetical protein
MSTAGYIALLGGGIVTVVVGAGRMFLIFYSNRALLDDQTRMQVANEQDGHQRPIDAS